MDDDTRPITTGYQSFNDTALESTSPQTVSTSTAAVAPPPSAGASAAVPSRYQTNQQRNLQEDLRRTATGGSLYVCVRVYMSMCVCMCTCVYMRVCMHVCMCVPQSDKFTCEIYLCELCESSAAGLKNLYCIKFYHAICYNAYVNCINVLRDPF